MSEVEFDVLKVDNAGSGNINLSGVAPQQKLSTAGSGGIDASGLEGSVATVTSAGSGCLEVRVSEKLDVSLVGSGSLRYHGDPKVSSNVLGSGRVEKVETPVASPGDEDEERPTRQHH